MYSLAHTQPHKSIFIRTFIFSHATSQHVVHVVHNSYSEHCYYHHHHLFNGPLSEITQVSWYQNDKTNLDLLEQEIVSGSASVLAHMQICTLTTSAGFPLFSWFAHTYYFHTWWCFPQTPMGELGPIHMHVSSEKDWSAVSIFF